MTRRLLLPLALLLAVAAVVPAVADAAKCKPPRSVAFQRLPGHTAGILSWKKPKKAPKGTRYRAYRDGAVVGQTKKLQIRVRVSVNRAYRFMVRPVSKKGKVQKCTAKLRESLTYVRASRPGDMAVTGASSAAAHLAWSPSQRGDAPLRAYRVYRNGATFKQISGTGIDVPLANNRTYKLSVAAIDGNGQLSDMSDTVTIESGHVAPPAPAGLTAIASSEATVDLAWQPSAPPRGKVSGYRIYRDGVLLRQVSGTTATVTNLGAASTHNFTVAAVDSLGWLSAQSAPVTVTTTPPEQTTGSARAFLLASTDASFADFRAHYRQIGRVYPTYYDCDRGTGAILGKNNPQITGWAQARGVKVLPRVNCQFSSMLDRILRDPATRSAWLDGIAALVDQNGYDGVNLDFEAGWAQDRDAFTSFVAELAQRMHARGKVLSVDVSPKTMDIPNHPRSTFFDYVQLQNYADELFVMAWGIHWSTSAPGAQDDAAWQQQVFDYISTMAHPEKFALGLQMYVMDWPAGREAISYEYADLASVISQSGATPQYDAPSDSWHLAYRGADGLSHDAWYPQSDTIGRRLQLARDHGLGGVGFWRLGHEDQGIWNLPLLAAGTSWP
ncbi:MAG: glycosyl hydrolase family 18 protein [Thermoleophilaceae bacterium]